MEDVTSAGGKHSKNAMPPLQNNDYFVGVRFITPVFLTLALVGKPDEVFQG
jgi:hypothetical protein